MKKPTRSILILFLALQVTGCSILSESGISPTSLLHFANEASGEPAKKDGTVAKIANPPARTIRFDGHEIVLGEAENQIVDPDKLVSMLEPLIVEQRLQTAATMILRHRESAERLLAERWATAADDGVIQLSAEVLSRRSTRADMSWKSLLKYGKAHKEIATRYQTLRNSFADEMRLSDPSNEMAEQLQQASLKVNHPLARMDALRLLGLRELVAGREAWAESLFRQAIEMATASGNPLVAAELWLTVAEAARRSNQMPTATIAWTNAVNQHLSSCKRDQPVDVSFWVLAEQIRPESINWPAELSTALGAHAQRIGCSVEGGSAMVLWASIAQAQFERGELQAALVNFKKSETLVKDSNVMWLRIAQAKCLAAMGQAPAAAAILSGPAASSEASISAAATAAMGSIKLQSGAYQQGAQLLHKALTLSPTTQWPMRNQSLADLAIAQLIIGDTDTGLDALHEAQDLLEKSGERFLLVQSLENELRLLEHEHRGHQTSAIKARILQLEK
jgi:tetratricopeptide (TPR) repeat protein